MLIIACVEISRNSVQIWWCSCLLCSSQTNHTESYHRLPQIACLDEPKVSIEKLFCNCCGAPAIFKFDVTTFLWKVDSASFELICPQVPNKKSMCGAPSALDNLVSFLAGADCCSVCFLEHVSLCCSPAIVWIVVMTLMQARKEKWGTTVMSMVKK